MIFYYQKYHICFLRRTTLIQYLLLYKVIYFLLCCFLGCCLGMGFCFGLCICLWVCLWVFLWVLLLLLCFMYMLVCKFVYACVCLYVCLWVGRVFCWGACFSSLYAWPRALWKCWRVTEELLWSIHPCMHPTINSPRVEGNWRLLQHHQSH